MGRGDTWQRESGGSSSLPLVVRALAMREGAQRRPAGARMASAWRETSIAGGPGAAPLSRSRRWAYWPRGLTPRCARPSCSSIQDVEVLLSWSSLTGFNFRSLRAAVTKPDNFCARSSAPTPFSPWWYALLRASWALMRVSAAPMTS